MVAKSETEHIATMSSNQVIKAAAMFATGGQASKVSVVREIAVASALGLAFGFYWQVIQGGGLAMPVARGRHVGRGLLARAAGPLNHPASPPSVQTYHWNENKKWDEL